MASRKPPNAPAPSIATAPPPPLADAPPGPDAPPAAGPAPPAPPRAEPEAEAAVEAPDAEFARPWMGRWVLAASRAVTSVVACAEAGVTLAEYLDARRRDPAFDADCREHDRALDLAITDSLRSAAMTGDIRAQSLYYHRVRDLIFDAPAPPRPAAIPPGQAEVLIAALLRADPSAPPSPSSSRPRPRAARQSLPAPAAGGS